MVSVAGGRQIVVSHAALGVVFSLCVIYTGMNFISINAPNLPQVTDRVVFAVRWLMPSFLPLVFGVLLVLAGRFINIQTAGLKPSLPISQQIIGLRQRALQNTLEQTVIHVAAVLALSTYLDGAKLKLIPISVFLFVFARIAFYIGYLGSNNSLHRAFGFSTTFMNNLVVLGYSLYCLFTDGASVGLNPA